MQGSDAAGKRKQSLLQRVESRLLQMFPASITPLRFRIFLGYLLVLVLAIYGWEHITTAWRYLLTLLAPAFALLGALLALKIGVVFVSLFTLLVAVVKFFLSFLVMVLKPGILKAILVPQVMSLLVWIHRKSSRLQNFFKTVYERFKTVADAIVQWWGVQNKTDKILLSGFLVPLLVILVIVFVIERAAAIFAIKKLTEQVVQKSTRFVIKHFHKVPVVGAIPGGVANVTRKLTVKRDREDVVEDFKSLGNELYQTQDADQGDRQGS